MESIILRSLQFSRTGWNLSSSSTNNNQPFYYGWLLFLGVDGIHSKEMEEGKCDFHSESWKYKSKHSKRLYVKQSIIVFIENNRQTDDVFKLHKTSAMDNTLTKKIGRWKQHIMMLRQTKSSMYRHNFQAQKVTWKLINELLSGQGTC